MPWRRRASITLLVTALTAAGLLATAGSVWASDPDQPDGRLKLFGKRYSILAGASVFVPSRQVTRSEFGSRHFGPSVRLWHFNQRPGIHLDYSLAYRVLSSERKADYFGPNVGVRAEIADPRKAVVPYWYLRVGPYGARAGESRYRLVGGAVSELGVGILDHLVVSSGYDLVGKVNGFNLSGWNAAVLVKVF